MKYELPDIFLHFLNKDAQEIFEISDDTNLDTIDNLQMALNMSVLLCNESCILPLGFYFESMNTKKIILDNIEYVRNGLLVFALREEEIQEYISKKQEQLKEFMNDIIYQRFFSKDEISAVSPLKHGIIERKTKIGQYCLLKWNESFSLFIENYSGDLSNIYTIDQRLNVVDVIETAKAIRNKAMQVEDGAFIWRPIDDVFVNQGVRDADLRRQSRRLFESYYYRAYLDEYNASILYDIFMFDRREDFLLKKEYFSASNYRWFDVFLKCLKLGSLLRLQPQQIVELRCMPEFIALRKLYLSICNEPTFTHNTNSISQHVSDMCLTNSNNINDLACAIMDKSFSETRKIISTGGNNMNYDDIAIGIVTALPKEYTAIKVLLKGKEISLQNENASAGSRYFIGEIESKHGGFHKVALCLLPKYGNNFASILTTKMLAHFKNIKNIVVCGIAGGVPSEVNVGDVVVSTNGIMQYDLAAETNDGFIPKDNPKDCSNFLLEAVQLLSADIYEHGSHWLNENIEIIVSNTHIDYSRPQNKQEKYVTIDKKSGCEKVARRNVPTSPKIHYGKIGSGNAVQKNAAKRESLYNQHKIIAIEMEGSGVSVATQLDNKGYLAVRGICDYCDSEKHDKWQEYAAAVAAAYSYELIKSIPAH